MQRHRVDELTISVHEVDDEQRSAADLDLAGRLVNEAGRLAATMRDAGLSTTQKTSISNIVTDADHAAEAHIAGCLRAERPDDSVVGEEGAAQDGGSGRTWFVDPVDGTYNFAAGLDEWCAAIGMTDAHGADVGAIYEPMSSRLWQGSRGTAATLNGSPLPALVKRPLDECSVVTYLHPTSLPDEALRDPLLAVIQGAATLRMLGSGSVELAAIAAGRIGAYIQTNCLDWDWLPGQAIVHAAGGTTSVFELHGHRWHLAGNAAVVADMEAIVRSF